MTYLKKTLLIITSLFCIHIAHADKVINIETKILGQDVVFVFYHDIDQIMEFSIENNKATATTNVPAEFHIQNPREFSQYASDFKIDSEKQRVSFHLIDDIKYQKTIDGEKLYALSFKSKKPKSEDLSNISKVHNKPEGVSYSQKQDQHILSFNLSNENSKIVAFFKGEYLWVVLDQKRKFSLKNQGIFSKFELIPSDKGTVIRILVKPDFHQARVEKIKHGWDIVVGKNLQKQKLVSQIITPEPLQDQNGLIIKGDFHNSEIITFGDPELGSKIAAITMSNGRVQQPVNSIEFSLLPSIQGVAILMLSDDLKLNKQDAFVSITSNVILSEIVAKENNFFITEDKLLDGPSLLPYMDNNLDIFDFNQRKSALISASSLARNDQESFGANIELAKFYFIHQWYQESLGALKVAEQYSEQDYKNSLLARFLTAVNYTMIGEHAHAQPVYSELLKYKDLSGIAEINLWSKYNEFALGADPGAIGFLNIPQKTKILYSEDKYWPIAFAEIEIALLANDRKVLDKIFKELSVPKNPRYANSLKYYKARYYKKKKQINLAKQYYQDIINNSEFDIFNQVRSELDLLQIRLEKKEVTVAESINTLERLRFMWRGDQLEYKILLQLAASYVELKDILSALRTYNYTQEDFNNKISNFYIMSEMGKLFNEVFLPGGIGEAMDDFTVVALFYEFKELNPIGKQGDDIILGIAKRLVKLDLLDQAAQLLYHQITYRLHGAKRVKSADNLAIIYIMDKRPNEAIAVLDTTDKDNTNFAEHEYRIRLRAKALISLGKYDDALTYLKDDLSQDAEILRKEALFKAEYWQQYIEQINLDFGNIVSRLDSDKSAAQDLLRLAISYYMLNDHDSLALLSSDIGNHNTALKTTVDLLIASSGDVDYKNIDHSLHIDQMKNLLDKYKSQFLNQ